ncbi:probable serine/threonine-protein kinase SIS8 isoform X2 [Abrus precatorius]|uniref:non-specific serine/threonine protein kinase n=1 Tax=Abrus precatorius TaxID=3816 RepID=A0A8B8MLI5_ABRPR|nr:probable serine/threonine-protein kinase SIS8 isoform X2 [Abrus precatorius]
MPKMKHLLRKLHIGGGAATINHNHNALPHSHTTPSSSSLPSPTVVSDPNPSQNDTNNTVVDFNLLEEEEFQMQLALAISASDSDPDLHDPAESAQIDAAKQISLGYAASLTDKQALVQFQSLRYWNYNVIGYDEKVMDGFYDVYGITSNLAERGKMPLLVDLQTKPVSGDVDCEVVLVNRVVDVELSQLERKACSLLDECCVSGLGLILSGLLQKLADVVVSRMGGPVGNADKITKRWAMRSCELRDSLGTIVLPLGCLDVGLSRHRALLFKVLADRINIPCMLVKGSYYTGTDDGAVNLIKADDGSEYIIDMMGAPGALIPAEVPSSQLQNCSFAVRSCAEIVGLPNNTHLMLDDKPAVPGVLSDCGGISTVGRVQREELLAMGSQMKPDEINHVKVNETGRFNRTEAYECSLHEEPSPAENMRVKDVSKYVLSAARNPEFAQKLHNVLVESGALLPPGLFSDINPQDRGVDKVNEKIIVDNVQADPNRLLLSYEKSLITSYGVGSASDTRLCQSADWLADQQKELRTDAVEFYNSLHGDKTRNSFVTVSDRDNDLEQCNALNVDSVSINLHRMCKEKGPKSALPRTDLSCKRHNEDDCFCDYDENGLRNHVGASFNNVELGKGSAVQINETLVNGDCVLYDGKNKVNPVLGEGSEWEIQWEDLRIGERIGIGSYGEVYRADCNGTEVAVKKFLHQDFSGDALTQFKSEVEIMLRLRHPNVVLFMGAITRSPHFSILTEFLPRGSLYRLLHRPNLRLDEKRRLRMALDVAKGMNYLHTSHPPIVHRDLKSPNLLVDKHWVVKVCDFGLSRMKHHTFLSSKSCAGTPEWMAPEVLRNEPANEKCDVYSFGVILWELTTTRIPWKGLNPMQVVGAVGFQNKRLEIPEDVNPVVAQIIHDCWQTEPHLRPSFSQLMSRLYRLQHLVVQKTGSTH